ncbi:hypothetical protein [Brachybacterium paraconglomeratum]|uniref:hypothetical protein n=1 Tax=Brachybacterium paraconglomeratum TaxID=173362 RepID=UPI00351685C5
MSPIGAAAPIGAIDEHVRRLTTTGFDLTYRRSGRQPVANPHDVRRQREDGQFIRAVADTLGCSLQAVWTALERTGRDDTARYPRLSTRRRSDPAELEHNSQLDEAYPKRREPRRRTERARGRRSHPRFGLARLGRQQRSHVHARA